MEHLRGPSQLSAFRSRWLDTAPTVGAETLMHLCDKPCVGSPTDARMDLIGDSRVPTLIVAATAEPNLIALMHSPLLCARRMNGRQGSFFSTLAREARGQEFASVTIASTRFVNEWGRGLHA